MEELISLILGLFILHIFEDQKKKIRFISKWISLIWFSFQSAKEKYDDYKEMGLLSKNIKSKIFK